MEVKFYIREHKATTQVNCEKKKKRFIGCPCSFPGGEETEMYVVYHFNSNSKINPLTLKVFICSNMDTTSSISSHVCHIFVQ